VGCQRHVPAALPPGKTRYPLYRRLGGPLGRSGLERKISPPPGFDPRTVQPVASRYTDWAIPAPRKYNNNNNNKSFAVTVWVREGVPPLILNFGARWCGWSVWRSDRFTSCKGTKGNKRTVNWVGLRADVTVSKNRQFFTQLGIEPRLVQPAAWLLYLLRYLMMMHNLRRVLQEGIMYNCGVSR